MACNDEFRHVCLKDLDNYIKRDQYFSDFSKEEITLIQKNLGIVLPDSSSSDYNPTLIGGTHQEIYNQTLISNLKVGCVYIIKDFRSLYLDVDGEICGTDDHIPSKDYWIFLTPNSSNTFDRRVRLFNPLDTSASWIVEYDITPVEFSDEISSKGTITYLKDNNNNYAYYDFKNIKFKKSLSELNNGPSTYSSDTYLYTFDGNGADASETTCSNNHLEKGVYRNVFMGVTKNTTLAADCHDNIFFKSCENCTFDYGTYGNYFQDNVKRCKGSVHQKILSEITSQNCPKQFDVLDDKEVIMYLDSQTQTYQVKNL